MKQIVFPAILAILLSACSSHPPIASVKHVDLDRFMGDWYVIANIPTFIEKGAYNAIESYELNDDGSVATTFKFREDGPDGDVKTYHPTGYIVDKKSNAVWGMQFIWPIKADYRIIYLDKEYQQTVIGRIQRDYIWIMARKPVIPEKEYQKILKVIADQGYDISKIQKVPQVWGKDNGQ
jgi:apolipoprotein D and lipocalin family protein